MLPTRLGLESPATFGWLGRWVGVGGGAYIAPVQLQTKRLGEKCDAAIDSSQRGDYTADLHFLEEVEIVKVKNDSYLLIVCRDQTSDSCTPEPFQSATGGVR